MKSHSKTSFSGQNHLKKSPCGLAEKTVNTPKSKYLKLLKIKVFYAISFTVVVKFSPPPGISQRFVGQVPFGGAFTRTSLLDRSNSGGGTKLDNHGKQQFCPIFSAKFEIFQNPDLRTDFKLPWLSSLVPPPEFDLSKKVILVTAPPKGTCPRNLCEIPGGD